jgi:hypothetical protein
VEEAKENAHGADYVVGGHRPSLSIQHFQQKIESGSVGSEFLPVTFAIREA